VTVDALFRQAGVVRTDTLAELFDVASLLANQPLPAGRRVAIVTNAGGPGILCADACEASDLTVPALSDGLRGQLAAFLPAEASTANPVDLLAAAPPGHYRQALELVVSSGEADAVVVIFIPPLATDPAAVATAIHDAAASGPVPVLAVFMSTQGTPEELNPEAQSGGVEGELPGDAPSSGTPPLRSSVAPPDDGTRRIPSYRFPEEAARALARAVEYGVWRATPAGRVPELDGVRRDEATGLLAAALAEGPRWLAPDEVALLLDCYGLPLAPWRLASTPEAAAAAAGELGGPVAVKAVAPGLIHKTEAGAVRLGLAGAERVRAAAAAMADGVAAAGHQVERFLVQRMVPAGVEMLVGVVHDPSFGPVVACGAGGTAVELLRDVQVRITPLTDADASAMVRSLVTFPLLDGYRGAPPTDVPALEDLLLRVGALVEAHPEVAELDLNPVMVRPRGEGAVVVDARVRVEAAPPPLPLAARRRS
jgi:acetate---CoA ligase (ADP-forming)